MKNVFVMFVYAALMVLGGCASTPIVTSDKVLGTKGTELLVGEFGYWRRDCTDRHFDIYIERYPVGGDLRFEAGKIVIPENPDTGSAGNCVGQTVQSKKIVYIANPNFVGQDSVSFLVKSSFLLGHKVYDVNIDVK